MDTDGEWLRGLIEQPPGSLIPSQDVAKLRIYICLASDKQVNDLIQIIREAQRTAPHTASAIAPAIPTDILDGLDAVPGLLERLIPTRPTRPSTAEGVLELVRRGPDVFRQLPVSYQLDALRAVVIRRNREQEEATRIAAYAQTMAAAGIAQAQGEVVGGCGGGGGGGEEGSERLKNRVDGQRTQLGMPSMSVHEWIENVLDREMEEGGCCGEFGELLVDQKYSVAELQQMLLILVNKIQIRMEDLRYHEERLPRDGTAEEEMEEMKVVLKGAEAVCKKQEGNVVGLTEGEYLGIIPSFLGGIADLEGLVADYDDREEEEYGPEEDEEDEDYEEYRSEEGGGQDEFRGEEAPETYKAKIPVTGNDAASTCDFLVSSHADADVTENVDSGHGSSACPG